MGPVLLGGIGFGGAIPLPVAGVVGAPFACAVAADLAIFLIADELALAALAAALPLAGLIRAGGLRRVKSGWLELPVAKTATPLIHPFTVTAQFILLPEMDSADGSAGSRSVKIWFAAECLNLRKISNWKKNSPSVLWISGCAIRRLAG